MDSKKKVRINETPEEIPSIPAPSRSAPVDDPLIPTRVVDEAFQRVFLISVFVLIQSWKIYDLLSLDSTASEPATQHSIMKIVFLMKYSLIDGIFLWLLPVLNVPYLIFAPLTTLVMTVGLNVVNVLLLKRLDISGSMAVVAPIWGYLNQHRELTLDGDAVNLNKVLDVDSHIRGRYTLNYLPDSLARFNVFDYQNMCQDPFTKNPIYVPMEFNMTTELGFLELEHTSPANTVSSIKISQSEINKLLHRDTSHLKKYPRYLKEDEIFYIEIPLYEPGTYKVSKIKDKSGTAVRHVLKTFSFPSCPWAKFTNSKLTTKNGYVCVGKSIDDISYDVKFPLVSVYGSAPLTLKFSKLYNGKEQDIVKTKLLASEKIGNFTKFYSHSITRNVLEQEILKNPKLLHFAKSGEVTFQLLEIIDAHGNLKKYNPSSDSEDLRYTFSVLNKPAIKLSDPAPESQLLINESKSLKLHADESMEEQFPLTALIRFTDPDDSLTSNTFTVVFNSQEEYLRGFQVSKPGKYELVSINGGRCACEVIPSAINVSLVTPPDLQIQAEPIIDKCVGTTGYNFNFDFSGSAPFLVEYTVLNNSTGTMKPVFSRQGKIVRQLHSNSNKFKFDYKPPGEGSYSIVFKTLRDLNYDRNPIQLDQQRHTYTTYFQQRSKASFFKPNSGSFTQKHTVCKSGRVSIPVFFTGHAPFDMTYALLDSNGVAVLEKSVRVEDDKYVIETPEINAGGNYNLILKQVLDTSGCAAELEGKEKIQIVARNDVPELGFGFSSSTKNVTVVEGTSYEIPLLVKSSIGKSSEDVISYQFTDVSGKVENKVHKGAGALSISKAGIYKLTKYTNGGCDGVVTGLEKQLIISFHAKPTMAIQSDHTVSIADNAVELSSGCHGCKRDITLSLTGKAPFIVEYSVQFPSGRTEPRSMQIDKNHITITLPTQHSGVYLHVFTGIYDSLYTKSAMQRIGNRQDLPKVSYEVYEAPGARFKVDSTVQVCEAAVGHIISDIQKVPIELKGKFPFTVNVTMEHESFKTRIFTFEDIHARHLDLNHLINAQNLQLGEYEFVVTGVKDGNGCQKKYATSTSLVLTVTPAPNITKSIEKKDYLCVGDHVGYNLEGISPFRLYYDFNGKQHSAKTGSQFRRLTSEPGLMKVLALEDSSVNQCMVNFTGQFAKDLEVKIHDLPSVEINEGDIIIEDIHQGDKAEINFSFQGTPPFTVKYKRYMDAATIRKSKKKSRSNTKAVENFVLKDIWDYEHKILVDREGTYEPYEVHDAYCTARKSQNNSV